MCFRIWEIHKINKMELGEADLKSVCDKLLLKLAIVM